MVYHVPVILTHTHIFKNTHTPEVLWSGKLLLFLRERRKTFCSDLTEREVTVSLDVKPDAGDVSAADEPVKGSH